MIEKIRSFLRQSLIKLMEDTVNNEYTEGFQMGYEQAIEDLRIYSRLHPEEKIRTSTLPPNFIQNIKTLWDDRQRIPAIKYYREHTNSGLYEAKHACELIGGSEFAK